MSRKTLLIVVVVAIVAALIYLAANAPVIREIVPGGTP